MLARHSHQALVPHIRPALVPHSHPALVPHSRPELQAHRSRPAPASRGEGPSRTRQAWACLPAGASILAAACPCQRPVQAQAQGQSPAWGREARLQQACRLAQPRMGLLVLAHSRHKQEARRETLGVGRHTEPARQRLENLEAAP